MSNRLAVYKQPHMHEAFEAWWYQVSLEDGRLFYKPDELFKSYTEYHMKQKHYKAITGFEDFMRLTYREGVRKVGISPTIPFMRAKTWRPSEDMVMRYELGRAL